MLDGELAARAVGKVRHVAEPPCTLTTSVHDGQAQAHTGRVRRVAPSPALGTLPARLEDGKVRFSRYAATLVGDRDAGAVEGARHRDAQDPAGRGGAMPLRRDVGDGP